MRYAAIALALAACTPPPCETCPVAPSEVEVDVCVDGAFSPDETRAIATACDTWTTALCGLVALRPTSVTQHASCDMIVYRVQSHYDVVAETDASNPSGRRAMAWASGPLRSAWVVVDRVPDGELAPVVVHEIGHLLGSDDTDDDRSIMRDPLNPYGCVDRRAAVIAALRIGERTELRCINEGE